MLIVLADCVGMLIAVYLVYTVTAHGEHGSLRF